jgi:hypothetical protein
MGFAPETGEIATDDNGSDIEPEQERTVPTASRSLGKAL